MFEECFCSEEEGASDVDVIVASYNRAPTQERKVYIACMHISPINVTISFLPAELQRRDHLNPNDITGTGHLPLMNGLPSLTGCVASITCAQRHSPLRLPKTQA